MASTHKNELMLFISKSMSYWSLEIKENRTILTEKRKQNECLNYYSKCGFCREQAYAMVFVEGKMVWILCCTWFNKFNLPLNQAKTN